MKVTDIIRGFLDLMDQASHRELDTMIPADSMSAHDQAIVQMRRMASILEPDSNSPEYTNSPDTQTQPVAAVIASGTDVHASKNPADIRGEHASMYPGYQKGCSE